MNDELFKKQKHKPWRIYKWYIKHNLHKAGYIRRINFLGTVKSENKLVTGKYTRGVQRWETQKEYGNTFVAMETLEFKGNEQGQQSAKICLTLVSQEWYGRLWKNVLENV